MISARALRKSEPYSGSGRRPGSRRPRGRSSSPRRRCRPAEAVARRAPRCDRRSCRRAPGRRRPRSGASGARRHRAGERLGRSDPRPRARGGAAGRRRRESGRERISASEWGGSTNREIAEELVLSVKTVEAHLRNIFAKLGVRRRVELTRALAREYGSDP
ncbi:MAG TPA: LuxR C-terminal-related transcriptional regulator [Solirubrobacteraceae bacterium]|nr:LuxR C-terminal-related transcriptional regulator [Solirubrobacteraceae bacterium]